MLKVLIQEKENQNYEQVEISTYLSTIESKKQTKQTRRTEAESWIQRAF